MRWFPLVACLCLASPASAVPSASLQWNSCSDAAPRNLDYAGPGIVNQVVSLHGFAGRVKGVSFEIEVRGPAGFPDAWRFDAAGCNAGALEFNMGFGKTCPAVGSGALLGTAFLWKPDTQVGRVRMISSITTSPVLDSTNTYVLGRLAYDQGACAGTEAPMCFELLSASVLDENGNEVRLALGNGSVSWQDAGQRFVCHPTEFRGARIDQFMLSCLSDTIPQYIQLRSTGENDVRRSAMHLRILDHTGAVRFDAGDLFGPSLEGTPWPADGAWLCATRGFEQRTGIAADFRIPAVLDSLGGRIELYEPQAGVLIHGVDYGPGTPSGQSLTRQPDGSFVAAAPTPQTASGQVTPFVCPTIIIREFAQGCSDGGTHGQFIELEALDDAKFDHLMRLEFAGDASVGEINLFPSMPDGTPWPRGKKWLIGELGQSPTVGVPLDRDVRWMALTRVIKLYGPTGALLDSVNWSDGGAVPVLYYGHSAERQPDLSWSLQAAPTPTNFAGQSGAGTACWCPGPNCTDSTMSKIRIDEFATRCLNGETGSQYIVLRAMGPGQQFHTKSALRISDLALNDRQYIDPFVGIPDGTPWPEGQAYLLAATYPGYTFPVTPDQAIGTLDPAPGVIRFFDTRSGGPLVDTVRYGPGQEVAAPARGEAVHRRTDGTPFVDAIQTPENFAGQRTTIETCPCGVRTLDLDYFSPEVVAPLYDRFDTTVTTPLNVTRYEYDASQGFQAVHADGQSVARTGGLVGTVFTLSGPVPGQKVPLVASLHLTGNSSGTCTPFCSPGWGIAWLTVSGSQVSRLLGGPTDVTLSVPFTATVGEPWRVDTRLRAELTQLTDYGTVYNASFESRLAFAGIPPGMSITSCAGFRDDTPTAARPALVSSRRDDGAVHLEWSVSDVTPHVERSEDGVAWVSLGTPTRSSALWTYDDATALATTRYAYRLAWAGDASEPVWIEAGAPMLALRALGSPGTPTLEFTLPTPARVRIEMLDLRGRRVSSRDLGMQAMGAHRVATPGGMRAGVYWARLLVGDEVRQLKLVVL